MPRPSGCPSGRSLPVLRLRDVHAPGRRGTVCACAQISLELAEHPLDPVDLHRRQGHTIDPGGTTICRTRSHASHRTSSRWIRSYRAWKRRPADCLAAAHSLRCSRRTLSIGSTRRCGVIGPGGPGHALTLTRSASMTKVGALPSRRVSCTPITGTTTPSDSRCAPFAFTTGLYNGLCPTRLAQTGLSCPGPNHAYVPPPYPGRTRPGRSGTPPVGHGLRRDMSGSAPPIVTLTRLQGSLDATAHALAPSKEALDTPLSPPPLNDEPGPATGRSGAYPDGTHTRRPGTSFQDATWLQLGMSAQAGQGCCHPSVR